ncbi:MAG TPA: bacteriohopanetetrol glucosamine biosynthesis glycosyltransferase HpnI [Rhizomicrobium sp.]|jgi:ceramide glucosyltransferase|nr:bacteriohopanetetrol glucosamine biosynthesis glycosyltransferase HpnI [Rhizomicrobium sp.]
MTWLFAAAVLLAGTGLLLSLAGLIAVRRFAVHPKPPLQQHPPVTILRPLCGDEPLLEEALVSCCRQAYPVFQIVVGVRDPADAALAVVRRVRDRFPDCDIAVVVDSAPHGPNPKVANLINMLPSARHPILVISDSDLQLSPDYLERLLVQFETPGTGLVTALSVGLLPPERSWLSRLGATQINHNFVPSVLMSRMLGRQDCLGSTVMLSRETLDRTGGLQALSHFLAEDNVLGRRVRGLGLRVALADTVALATVSESSFRALWLHEIRWARTIRTVAPLSLAASPIQHPLFWTLVAVVLSGAAFWSVALFAASWVVRALLASGVDRALGRGTLQPMARVPVWLLPLRDLLSVAEIAASFWINDVVWRGHLLAAKAAPNAPIKAGDRRTATS